MSQSRPSIDDLWRRIKALERQDFKTKTGRPFTYTVSGDIFQPNRTKYNISKVDFAKALARVPFDGPGAVKDLVRGPSYLWAVLHDRRVRRSDW